MKAFLFILIYLFMCWLVKCDNNSALLTRAFENITKLLIESRSYFSIINYVSDDDVSASELAVLKSLKNEYRPCSVKTIESNKQDNFVRYEVDESAVITFGSSNSLEDFNSKAILTNDCPKRFLFFVYCKISTFASISSLSDSEILQFQYFLIEDEKFVTLNTFVWYTPEQCNVTQLVEINRFSKKTKHWKTKTFSINKLENFHGCRVSVGVMFQNPFLTFEQVDGQIVFGGINFFIFQALAESFNFTLFLNPYYYRAPGMVYHYPNESIDWLAEMTKFKYWIDVMDVYSCSRPYLFYDDVIVIPPGEEYTAYEKMRLPFDATTWFLIFFTFVTAISTILVLMFMNRNVRNFVFGRNITTPVLNVALIFFGISQIKLPRRNFARFLVMSFVLFSLIIRTAWQAMIYEQMQKNMTKPQISSIDELAGRKYPLYAQGVYEYEMLEMYKRQVLKFIVHKFDHAG